MIFQPVHLSFFVTLVATVTGAAINHIQDENALMSNPVIEKLLKGQEELETRLEEDEKRIEALTEDNQRLREELQENNIAFYVHLSNGNYAVTEGSLILYDVIVTNLGNGYNPASGSFTCLQNGYYIFTIFYLSDYNADSDLAIMVNDNIACRGDADDLDYNQGTCTAIVELQVGDVVNVKSMYGGSTLLGSEGGNVNGFSGFLYSAL